MTKRKASVALDSIGDCNTGNDGHDDNNNGASSELTGSVNNSSGSSLVQHHQNGNSSTATVGSACQQQDLSSNNQNDNSIGSNTSSNGGAGQSHKSKKERADNWSSAEIQVLHKGLESRRELFYGPPTLASKKSRELAWEGITREVNAVSTTPRSLSQVMKKFKNEKCRAKRKFVEPDKEGHNNSNHSSSNHTNKNNNSSTNNNNLSGNNNVSNSSHSDSTTTTSNNCVTSDTTSNTNLSAQNHANNGQQQTQAQQQQQQSHHMTSTDHPMSVAQPSINVVKLAPQNVAKTMIDLPGHVQQIQMPNEDMVLIVPPDMDGLLGSVNIVSDGNGHHHFQKCSSSAAMNNNSHNHHNQHSLQTLNTGQTLVNGTMSNGMMARTIPASSMCSLVYSTGNEVCLPDHQVSQGISGQASLASHHLGMNAQNLSHHRGTIDQSQIQQQQQQQLHHQMHHQQQPQSNQQQQQHHQHHQHQQPHQQQQQSQQQQLLTHQSQLPSTHNQQQLSQNHLNTQTAMANTGGVAVESQLKNLLFNLLLKDGQQPSIPMISSDNQDNKHRNDMLAVIASSLSKIEGHLSKISKVATSLAAQNISSQDDGNIGATTNQINSSGQGSLGIGNSDGNNNSVITNASSNMQSTRREGERR